MSVKFRAIPLSTYDQCRTGKEAIALDTQNGCVALFRLLPTFRMKILTLRKDIYRAYSHLPESKYEVCIEGYRLITSRKSPQPSLNHITLERKD